MKGLYLVTPDWGDTEKLVSVSEAGLRGGATVLQYRHKAASPELRREQAGRLFTLCHDYRVPLIVNDHLDLCVALGADGLHVGGADMGVAKARTALGADKIVGASCYGSFERARAACAAGASYLALGGFYPSRIKKYPLETPLELITQVKQSCGLPVVVIGGMTLDNAPPLVAAGADSVAVISAVYFADDPEAATRQIIGKILRNVLFAGG